jgi:starch synthase
MIRVLHVCSEIYPLLKTGGLADVAGALPPALVRLGCDARVLVPGFPTLLTGIEDQKLVAELKPAYGASAIRVYCGTLPNSNIRVYVIDAPGLYDRPGNPYSDSDNLAYPDNYQRFALLGWIGARMAQGLDRRWTPQILHGHDWHAGLMPAYLRAAQAAGKQRYAGSVFTVHNLAYQGLFPGQTFSELGLPGHFFNMNGLEFHGHLSFMKAGLFYSDKLTTVSPTYAKEIQEAEQGCGLDGLLISRKNDLLGILNGVDPNVWNPAMDKAIAANYMTGSVAGKTECKVALQKEVGLAIRNDAPLFGVVSRLTEQKGLQLVLTELSDIVRRGGQVVVLGTGDVPLETAFKEAAAAHPEAVAVHIGYDEDRSHRVIAGCDVIMVPSRFEPCGLTQLYGLRYGTIPLVRRVGGLADSVADCTLENIADKTATGFVFDQFDSNAFNAAVRRAFALYSQKDNWTDVQKWGMQQEFSWDVAAKKFLSLYRQIAA